MDDDLKPYQLLADAIVFLAVQDYRVAYELACKNPRNKEYQNQLAVLRRFFRSAWYDILCNTDGEYMIRKIEESVRSMRKHSLYVK